MDEEGKYRLRPQRLLAIADLFGMAAFYDMAKQLDERECGGHHRANQEHPPTSQPLPSRLRLSDLAAPWCADACLRRAEYPHVGISGLQSDVARVKENDFYCCPSTDAEEVPFLAAQARLAGASALLLPDVAKDLPAMADVAPEGGPTPVFFVENVDVAAARLAVAFYEAPSREMLMIGVLGTHGKTTTAWLIRGILEEMGQVRRAPLNAPRCNHGSCVLRVTPPRVCVCGGAVDWHGEQRGGGAGRGPAGRARRAVGAPGARPHAGARVQRPIHGHAVPSQQ